MADGGVQSVERSFRLLEALAGYPRGATIKELAEALSLPKSTIHRLLGALIQAGYALQNEESGRYRASIRMFEVGSRVVGGLNLLSTARPYIERLAARVGETVHLVVRDEVDAVYVHKAEAGSMTLSSRVGLRIPLYCAGVGKAILATLPVTEVEHIWAGSDIQPRTSKTILELSELKEQLERVRRQGWAFDDEENEVGIQCVAFSLPGPSGRADAAFSISALAARLNQERLDELVSEGKSVQQAILREGAGQP